MLNNYLSAWKRPFDFKGRTNRKEYWYFIFLNILFFIFTNILLSLVNIAIISLLSDSVGFEFIATFLQVIVKTIELFSGLLIFVLSIQKISYGRIVHSFCFFLAVFLLCGCKQSRNYSHK